LDKWVKEHRGLLCVVTWELRLARNEMIFHGKDIPSIWIIHQLKFGYGAVWKPSKVKLPRSIISPCMDISYACSYFDGSCQGEERKCRVGGVLYLK